MIDSIGERCGWANRSSDAQGEWWHLTYHCGELVGKDPGPTCAGTEASSPTLQVDYFAKMGNARHADVKMYQRWDLGPSHLSPPDNL